MTREGVRKNWENFPNMLISEDCDVGETSLSHFHCAAKAGSMPCDRALLLDRGCSCLFRSRNRQYDSASNPRRTDWDQPGYQAVTG